MTSLSDKTTVVKGKPLIELAASMLYAEISMDDRTQVIKLLSVLPDWMYLHFMRQVRIDITPEAPIEEKPYTFGPSQKELYEQFKKDNPVGSTVRRVNPKHGRNKPSTATISQYPKSVNFTMYVTYEGDPKEYNTYFSVWERIREDQTTVTLEDQLKLKETADAVLSSQVQQEPQSNSDSNLRPEDWDD